MGKHWHATACRIDDAECSDPPGRHYPRGLCRFHYGRWKNTGRTDLPIRFTFNCAWCGCPSTSQQAKTRCCSKACAEKWYRKLNPAESLSKAERRRRKQPSAPTIYAPRDALCVKCDRVYRKDRSYKVYCSRECREYAFPPRDGVCVECDQIYKKSHPKTLYCSKRCSRRVHQRRRASTGLTANERDDMVAWVRIIRRDPCSYCGGLMEHNDHVRPKARGGTDHWHNLTASCASCNIRKSDKSLLNFLLSEVTRSW